MINFFLFETFNTSETKFHVQTVESLRIISFYQQINLQIFIHYRLHTYREGGYTKTKNPALFVFKVINLIWFLAFHLNWFYESVIHIVNERGGSKTTKYISINHLLIHLSYVF